MKLELRTKDGNMIAKYLGAFAETTFSILNDNENLFNLTVKRFKNDKDPNNPTDAPTFVCKEYCKLLLTNEFELWLEPGDYFKIIR